MSPLDRTNSTITINQKVKSGTQTFMESMTAAVDAHWMTFVFWLYSSFRKTLGCRLSLQGGSIRVSWRNDGEEARWADIEAHFFSHRARDCVRKAIRVTQEVSFESRGQSRAHNADRVQRRLTCVDKRIHIVCWRKSCGDCRWLSGNCNVFLRGSETSRDRGRSCRQSGVQSSMGG